MAFPRLLYNYALRYIKQTTLVSSSGKCSHYMVPVYVCEASVSRDDWVTMAHKDKWGDDVIPCGRSRWVTYSAICSLFWLASTDMIMMTKALPINISGTELLRDSLWCSDIERLSISAADYSHISRYNQRTMTTTPLSHFVCQ